MGSRDRPHREVKKKAKAAEPKPKLSPFLEPPQSVESSSRSGSRGPSSRTKRGLTAGAGGRRPLPAGRRHGQERDEMALTSDRRVEQRREAGGERGRPSRRRSCRSRSSRARSIMRLGSAERQQVDLSRRARSPSTWPSASAASPAADHRDLRPVSSGKTTVCLHISPRPSAGRGGRLHRRRARPRSGLRPGLRGQRRRAAGQPARHRRAGPRDHRDAHPLGRIDVVVVDSVAALVPRAEIEGEMGDSFVGIQARLMSRPCAS